jgi:catechol 2,3-dioxygenase-like lactoylglutathione lyase family enzyme
LSIAATATNWLHQARLTLSLYNIAMTNRANGNIEGLSHITFIVRNLQLTARFFCEGLGAQEVYDSAAKNFSLSREKFFVLGGIWIACMEGEPPGERTYRHTAFKVNDDDLPQFEARLQAIGVEIKPPRNRVEGEGQSLYFYDFDNHLFELHTGTLEQRLLRYQSDSSLATASP